MTLVVIPLELAMPNYGAKVSSAYISTEAIRDFITALPTVIRDIYGSCNVTAYYGHACNLHMDLLYKPMGVSLEVFPYFIEDSIA